MPPSGTISKDTADDGVPSPKEYYQNILKRDVTLFSRDFTNI